MEGMHKNFNILMRISGFLGITTMSIPVEHWGVVALGEGERRVTIEPGRRIITIGNGEEQEIFVGGERHTLTDVIPENDSTSSIPNKGFAQMTDSEGKTELISRKNMPPAKFTLIDAEVIYHGTGLNIRRSTNPKAV